MQHVALQSQASKFSLPHNLDQSGVFQLFQVVGERGRADGLAFAQLGAGGGIAFTDLLEDRVSARIRQGAGD